MEMKQLVVYFICYLSSRANAADFSGDPGVAANAADFSGDPGVAATADFGSGETTAPTQQCFEEECLDKLLWEYEELTLNFITKYRNCINKKNNRFLEKNNGDCPSMKKVKNFEDKCYNKAVGIEPNGTITLGNIKTGVLNVVNAGGACPGANALLWLQQIKVDMQIWLAEFTDCLYEQLASGSVACVQESKLNGQISSCFSQAQQMHNQAVVSDSDAFTAAFGEYFLSKLEYCMNPPPTTAPVEVKTTTAGEEITTAGEETTTAGVETTTAETETTTAEVETTTAGAETTTAEVETTTAEIETTTAEVETTTAGVETTTAEVETTTAGVETILTQVETTSTGVDSTTTGADITPTTEQHSCYPVLCFVDLISDLTTTTKLFIKVYKNCIIDKISNFKSKNNGTCPLKKKVKTFEETCYDKAYKKQQNATIIIGRIRRETKQIIIDPSIAECSGDNATRWLDGLRSDVDPWMTQFFNCMEGSLVSGLEMCFGISKLRNATETCHQQTQDANKKEYVTIRKNFIDPFVEYFQTFLEENCITSTTPMLP